ALWDEFGKTSKNKLPAFHDKLGTLTFFDPACGCGTFLVITYRELRRLELAVLKKLHDNSQQLLDISALLKVDVDQFYGIEIEEFPAQIAQVALWLTDHQMNQQISVYFGAYFARIPLKHSATIINANALQTDWAQVCPKASFILGNPPFIGKNYRSTTQDVDMAHVFTQTWAQPIMSSDKQELENGNHHSLRPICTDRQTESGGHISGAIRGDSAVDSDSARWISEQAASRSALGCVREEDRDSLRENRREIQPVVLDGGREHRHFNSGVVQTYSTSLTPIRLYKSLDFVSAWHYTATAYMKSHPQTRTAFVSTNSITQGEQVAILWQPLLDAGIYLQFAHRTFSWSNEASGKAAVHCVIIGFGLENTPNKTIYIYDDIKGEPHAVSASNINPYLLDAPNVLVTARGTPICHVPEMIKGNEATDDGHLVLSTDEK
ncbi:MAG: DNA methyltransferase, partial [Sulfuriferula sp.]